ncbi:MAG: Natural resistance-associated macrophage protein [Candidatus Nomurabacteria bacterium GW2011_GWF2_35_66]|uniref:Natural resistance-associated macrophage protein n=1 Tax=Candidatus Nomurabacteria bacterium GW2011_GWE1_35_16 TaxID=1618761 RepID=A0A0G0EG45_9BACT|nr:MAG: Natural resistance-associated macrophage protein [Candidatus Nomurabacteria bacterium GW2011_GWF1_34_20]KKP63159.1 MAG: Natural resistance-associated macrophage protein [Candidatus Nomurabacteria bacterium GW2011_GWE2_34_25]KKP66312.1 MAG: Natural resistance-associated macrophage protein [Candidatus Nomurabacteria bacterium GW2011_GWE1_35_16]KKP83245.1 MAG: Natural resistance-associated macrophage protein [Candidatus Nomurabacteria bacterium GW2011_GWF2_35_66]HAE36740.1 iron transporter
MKEKELVENTESLSKDKIDYLKKIGPGVITGAADDDPSGITTYSQTGAQYGTGLLWMALWIYPLVSTVQEMCARIAMVTGRGLASNIKRNFPKKILYICTILLFFANTLNIGADLGAMAKAVQLLAPKASFVFLVIFTGIAGLLLEIIVPYRIYTKYLKWLVIAVFSYIVTGLIIHMDWSLLLRDGIIPHITFSKTQILLITGILGTTISPYLFFWQTSEEIEEEIMDGKKTLASRKGTTHSEIKEMRMDIWVGMFLSNLVMFFIIAVCANTLFVNGITNIETAADAALALKPLAGSFATLLFAIGIIGTGLLAIPVLAGSTAYAITESFGWKEGLYRKWKTAHAFYGVIAVSIIIGIILNFIGIDPIKALLYSAIANGIVAPVILVFIVKISSSQKIMGEFKNKPITKTLGWIATILMSITAVAATISLF